jgi:hypothetical protein
VRSSELLLLCFSPVVWVPQGIAKHETASKPYL